MTNLAGLIPGMRLVRLMRNGGVLRLAVAALALLAVACGNQPGATGGPGY